MEDLAGGRSLMNDRERFRRLMRGERVDRPPLFEEGVREGVLDLWHEQGLPAGKSHLDVFGLTPHENIGPDIKYRSSYFGRVFDLSTQEYRNAFDITDRRFPEDWKETAKRLETRDHVVCIWASRGFFQALGVGDWPTLESALIGTVREKEKIRGRMEHYGEFCSSMLERTLQDVDPEFIYLSEPISNNGGPLISPDAFAEFMIPVYERIIPTARGLGCENILVSTYGDTSPLFPMLMEAGVSMFWVSEAAEIPELDYRRVRQRLGGDLGLIGGIPLSILRNDRPDLIREKLEEIVAPLLRAGRYIPLAGGRVREEITWPVYREYREGLADLMG